MNTKELVALEIKNALENNLLSINEIEDYLEHPKRDDLGDISFPTFVLSKILHKNPKDIAEELAKKINVDKFEKVEVVGPYINFFIKKTEFASNVLHNVLTEKNNYGDNTIGKDQNVTIDMSSPNIAKPMSMGHLRSTVIGNALANIFAKNGFNPIKINHLGDWGTQFGKLIQAYKLWGSEEEVKRDPINTLLKYYVKFHKEAEKDESLNDKARAWFTKLEDGDEEATRLWKWFSSESLKEFKSIYDELGVTFDHYTGESFYNDKMPEIIDILNNKGLLKESRGVKIVDLDKYNLNPAVIQKSDGSSLYITRDLATALYRKREYNFVQSLYVVGSEQRNHFDQLKAVLKEMGFEWANDIHYIPFGLITLNGQKLSTRAGRVVLLKDVISDSVNLALEQIKQKNPSLQNKEEVAHSVGVGAIIFHDLKNEKINQFDFDLKEVVHFEGDTGPYVQYAHARAESILRKSNCKEIDLNNLSLNDINSWDIIKQLNRFPEIIVKAMNEYEPSVIAKYSLNLARSFNKYYGNTKILVEDDYLNARLALVKSVSIVLKESLRLLGVEAPNEM